MESNNIVQELPQEPISQEENVNAGSESSEKRILELATALQVVQTKFIAYSKKLKLQIRIWSCICVGIILGCIILACILLHESFPDKWNWQIGYISIIRITIATAVFALASFCFKLFRSYVHLNEHNSHNITVIESMANLVGAAKDEIQRNLIYGKLIDIIIQFADTGLLNKEQDFKNVGTFGIDALQKIIEKSK